ncbi:hypothetical protein AAG906_026321 [Vitis piasezkii]
MFCATIGRERVSAVQCTFTVESARPVNNPITFPPIDINRDLSSYNTIIRSSYLHKMKVIPSTYHKMDECGNLGEMLCKNKDILVWIHSDMLGIDLAIPMFPHDKENMTFITHKELYFYKIMSFGLMNIGATYQQLMTHIFKPLIGRTLEVYIDDIVIKRITRSKKLLHLEEAFSLMCRYDMKLNPLKYAFRVIDLAQVKVVLEIPGPTSKKEVQRLIGCLITLVKPPQKWTKSNNEEQWRVLHVDEASRTSEDRIGLTQQSLMGEQIEHVVYLNFPVSNIEAKYEAILMGRSSLSSHNHESRNQK